MDKSLRTILTWTLLLVASTGCSLPIAVPAPTAPRCELRAPPVWPSPKFARCGDNACTDAASLNKLWLYQRNIMRWEAEVQACGGQPVSNALVEAVRQPN